MSLWANTLIQNEGRYVWFTINSVIDYVDKILIWDTGSSDQTPKIVKEISKHHPGKIEFCEVGTVDPNEFTEIRKRMLKKTESEWILVLDGDEVWWDSEIKSVAKVSQKSGSKYDCIVTKYINAVGDIFHYQDESAGKYEIKGRKGFLTIRAINRNNIRGLAIAKPHGQQGFYDVKGNLIQDRNENRMLFMEKPGFLHFTNLPRSDRDNDFRVPKRKMKYKYELGRPFQPDFYYPEVFFRKRPEFVQNPWVKRDSLYFVRAGIETPLRSIKRRIYKTRSGY